MSNAESADKIILEVPQITPEIEAAVGELASQHGLSVEYVSAAEEARQQRDAARQQRLDKAEEIHRANDAALRSSRARLERIASSPRRHPKAIL